MAAQAREHDRRTPGPRPAPGAASSPAPSALSSPSAGAGGPVDPAAITGLVHAMIPIVAAMGVEIVEAGRTDVAARLPLAPNANHVATTYAGSLFTVAELLGGVYASTSLALEGAVPLVRSLTIDFLRPAATDVVARTHLPEDEIARILAEVAQRGRADFELVAEVSDAAGAVVAATTGRYQLRRL